MKTSCPRITENQVKKVIRLQQPGVQCAPNQTKRKFFGKHIRNALEELGKSYPNQFNRAIRYRLRIRARVPKKTLKCVKAQRKGLMLTMCVKTKKTNICQRAVA